MKKLYKTEDIVQRLKEIDKELTRVELTENRRLLLNYERQKLLQKLKRIY